MKTNTIPYRELCISITASMLVRTFYTFPRASALLASTAAPWVILLAGGATLLLFWPIATALAARPGKGLIDLALEVGGRPLAILMILPMITLLIVGTGFGIRQASEMAVTGFYPHTPQTFAMATLILIAAIGAALEPPNLVWMATVAILPTLLSLLVVLIGNIGWGEVSHLLPMTGHGLLPSLGTVLPLTSFFGELIYAAIVGAYLQQSQKIMSAATYGLGISTIISAITILVYLMIFPLPGGLAFPFPLLEMTRLVQGSRFLERIDILWIWLWGMGSAGLAAGALQSVALLLKDTFAWPSHRLALPSLASITLTTALIPPSQADAILLELFWVRRWGFLPLLALPALIALIASMRDRTRHA